MPINVQCKGCSQKFQAPDQSAGKQVKCPNCSAPIDIPSPDQQTRITGKRAAQPAALKKAQQLTPEQLRALEKKRVARREAIEAHLGEPPPDPEHVPDDALDKLAQTELPEWHVQTDDGEEYGPVTKAELEEWVADGRLDQTCQVIHEDWDQWKWAEEVFPDLAAAAEPEPDNPFQQWAAADTTEAPVIPDVAVAVQPFPDAPRATTTAPRVSPQTRGGRGRRYPALIMTAKIYEVLSWVVGGLGLLVMGGVAVAFLLRPVSSGATGFLTLLMLEVVILLYTFITVITMKAIAELITLMINLENDNHSSADAMQQVVALLSKQQGGSTEG